MHRTSPHRVCQGPALSYPRDRAWVSPCKYTYDVCPRYLAGFTASCLVPFASTKRTNAPLLLLLRRLPFPIAFHHNGVLIFYTSVRRKHVSRFERAVTKTFLTLPPELVLRVSRQIEGQLVLLGRRPLPLGDLVPPLQAKSEGYVGKAIEMQRRCSLPRALLCLPHPPASVAHPSRFASTTPPGQVQ